MKSPFKPLVPKHHGQRNAFDLSRKALFTANVGQLLPFFCQEVQPGDHLEISENSFTRTQPCETAAYIRATEHREFFFVPYRYLWSNWQQFITQVNDYHSSLMEHSAGYKVPTSVPMLSLQALIGTFLYEDSPVAPSPSFPGNLQDLSGSFYSANFLRLFNMLGYGRLKVNWDNSSPARKVDVTNSANLSDNLYVDPATGSASDYMINPFRILAYQKIFYDYYRKSDWSPNTVSAYNVDYPTVDANGYFRVSDSVYTSMWTLHYRPYKMDYFTGVRPSEYWYGTVSSGQPQSGIDNGSLVELPSSYVNKGSYEFDFVNLGIDLDVSGTISPNKLRVAYALDKYLRTTQAAGKHYDDQILAHFGVKVNPDTAHEVSLLGAFSTPLAIGEVISTADTAQGSGSSATGAAVGSVFGKGIADGTRQNGLIKFDAQEHGIVMGIYSVGLESDYSAFGIDAFNIKRSRADYYMPEFDEVGPHVIRPEQVDLSILHFPPTDLIKKSVLGLVDPYLEYKSVPDRVYGDFMLGGNLEKWTGTRVFGSDFSPLAPISPPILYRSLNVSDLYIDPRVLDNVFGISSQLSDQLLVNDYTIVSAIRNMSVHGSPRL